MRTATATRHATSSGSLAARDLVEAFLELRHTLLELVHLFARREVQPSHDRLDALLRLLLDHRHEPLTATLEIFDGALRPLLDVAAKLLRLRQQVLDRLFAVFDEELTRVLADSSDDALAFGLDAFDRVLDLLEARS